MSRRGALGAGVRRHRLLRNTGVWYVSTGQSGPQGPFANRGPQVNWVMRNA